MAWTKLYRRSLFKNIRYPEHHTIFEDTFTTWRLMLSAKSVSFQNIITYNYRNHREGSILTTMNEFKNYYITEKALGEKIAIMGQSGLDPSYIYELYRKYLKQLYNTALEMGKYEVLKSTAYKIQLINKYSV